LRHETGKTAVVERAVNFADIEWLLCRQSKLGLICA